MSEMVRGLSKDFLPEYSSVLEFFSPGIIIQKANFPTFILNSYSFLLNLKKNCLYYPHFSVSLLIYYVRIFVC